MNAKPNLEHGREVLRAEGRALLELADRLGEPFSQAVELILKATGDEHKGRVIVAGMGKAYIIGQKISATLASTGTPSWAIHPADAPHGDLGRITPDDIVLALSKSGETGEMALLINHVKRLGARVISITGQKDSPLGRSSDIAIEIGDAPEACPLGLAPSTSTTAMLAVGDALALTVLKRRGFTREQFAAFHPGGALGRSLIRVEEIMRTGDVNVTVPPDMKVNDVLTAIGGVPNSKGRAGAACVVDARGRLVGFFSLGDLRRKLQQHGGALLTMPISSVMTTNPATIRVGSLAVEASRTLAERKFDELPVVEADGRLAGLIDVQDLLQLGFL
jgi:arabinose-5-phosphate isomerase